MKLLNSIILICFTMILFWLPSCISIKKEFADKGYYKLEAVLSDLDQESFPKGSGLLIKEFQISPAFESNTFVYRLDENRYENDFYNEFITSPSRMITDTIRENLYSSPHFKPIPVNIHGDINFRLKGKIISLYGDYRNPEHPVSVISIRMILEKRLDNKFIVFSNNVYTQKSAISQENPGLLIKAWNKNLHVIIKEFLSKMQKQDN